MIHLDLKTIFYDNNWYDPSYFLSIEFYEWLVNGCILKKTIYFFCYLIEHADNFDKYDSVNASWQDPL